NHASSQGGGIFSTGILTITGSTLSGNSASSGGGLVGLDEGLPGAPGATIVTSTLSGNTARGEGGGIFEEIGRYLNVIDSTISGNTADSGAGGIKDSAGM